MKNEASALRMKWIAAFTSVAIGVGSATSLASPRAKKPPVICSKIRLPQSELTDKRTCDQIASSLNAQPKKVIRRVQSLLNPNQHVDESANPDWLTYARSPYTDKLIRSAFDHTKRQQKAACCLHYVMQDLLDGCFFNSRTGTEFASDFRRELVNAGFRNILRQVAAKGSLASAPRGAILIYASIDSYGRRHHGEPGHIEIKNQDGHSTYTSFYTSDLPRTGSELAFDGRFRSSLLKRELIGIYIKPDGRPKNKEVKK